MEAAKRRAEPSASDPDDQSRDAGGNGADGAGLGEGGEQSAPLGRAVIGRSPRRNVRHAHHSAAILATLPVAACPDFRIARS